MSGARTYDYASARIVVDGREVTTRPAASVGPQRPALAHVLAALTDGHVARYADVESVQPLGPITRPGYGCWPWAVETPAEAVEALHTRGLWPWAPGDDAAPRWWCEAECSRHRGIGGAYRCDECGGAGTAERYTADPPTLAALVAVASLGCATLRAAEGLALQLVGRAPRIVWRVMTREAIASWVRACAESRIEQATVEQGAGVAAIPWADSRRGSRNIERWVREAPAVVRRAWPMLQDLAALGLHLVALDGDRVTLAVEAV